MSRGNYLNQNLPAYVPHDQASEAARQLAEYNPNVYTGASARSLESAAGDALEEVAGHRGTRSLRLMIAKLALAFHAGNIDHVKQQIATQE